ncbi:UNVERIFIED_CONTAM: hypothetical protein RMT77_006234 [Armadillidium vulgare]
MSKKGKFSFRQRKLKLKRIVSDEQLNKALSAVGIYPNNHEIKVENINHRQCINEVMLFLHLKNSKKNAMYVERKIAKKFDKLGNSNIGKMKKKSLKDKCEIRTRNDIGNQTNFEDDNKMDEYEMKISTGDIQSLGIISPINEEDEVLFKKET